MCCFLLIFDIINDIMVEKNLLALILKFKGGVKLRGFEICSKYKDAGLKKPLRKTRHSVAYDMYAAEDIIVPSIIKHAFSLLKNKDEKILPTFIPTGIKAYFEDDEVLILANKSSFPKKVLIMANGIGVIECDYYNNPTNEGELFFQYYNIFPFDIKIKKGDSIGQAYFQKFLKADDDNFLDADRTGGFGSTGNN